MELGDKLRTNKFSFRLTVNPKQMNLVVDQEESQSHKVENLED